MNLVGYRVKIKKPYLGKYRYGKIMEQLGNGNYFGVYLAGYYYNHRPITVDFCRKELIIVDPPCKIREN